MTDFDKAYASFQSTLYGLNPSFSLVLFVKTEAIIPGPAIDIGCGAGRNALFLASMGFQVTAIDISTVAIDQLLREAKRRGLNLHAEVVDARTWDYPSNHYNLVVVDTFLDHLDCEDGNAMIATIKRIIAPKGYLYAGVFTTDDPGYRGVSASSTAQFVKRYFHPKELLEAFSELTVLRYHLEVFLDRTHDDSHYHSIARLMAQKEPPNTGCCRRRPLRL